MPALYDRAGNGDSENEVDGGWMARTRLRRQYTADRSGNAENRSSIGNRRNAGSVYPAHPG